MNYTDLNWDARQRKTSVLLIAVSDYCASQASDTAFVCPVCVQRFSTSKALMRHQAQLHSATSSAAAAAGRQVMCAICTLDFANERELLAHLVGAQHKDMKARHHASYSPVLKHEFQLVPFVQLLLNSKPLCLYQTNV